MNILPALARGALQGRSFNNISFFSIIFLDTGGPAPYIGPVNARSAPAAAGRRLPKKSKRRTRRRTVRDRTARPAFQPAAASRTSHAPLGLTAGPRPIRPSGSTLRFRRAIVPRSCLAVPPRCRPALPHGREAGNFPTANAFAHFRVASFQLFQRVKIAGREKNVNYRTTIQIQAPFWRPAPSGERGQARPSAMSETKGLVRRSCPKVETGPWPGMKAMSSPSGNSLFRMLAIRSS